MPRSKDPNYQNPNRAQIVQREITAWELRCRGWKLVRIAKHMGLSIEGVRKIIARVEDREARNLSKNVHRVKVRQNGEIQTIKSEGFGSWFTSKKPQRRVIRKEASDGSEPVDQTVATSQCGDPRYLHLVLAAQEAERSLHGLNIADAPNPSGYTIADLTLEEDMKQRREMYEKERKAEVQPPSEEKPS